MMEGLHSHIMVDLETLGTNEDSVILSAGFVKFSPLDNDTWESLSDSRRCFYVRLNEDEQVTKLNRKTDNNTLLWWRAQSATAQGLLNETTTSLLEFIYRLNEFCIGTAYLWGNGATFDNVLLRHLYRQMGVKFPFNYNRDMDLRTAMLICQPATVLPVPAECTLHFALDDAKYQILKLQSWMREFKNGQRPGSAVQDSDRAVAA